MIWPIYIPSYGRAGWAHTIKWLREFDPNVPLTICVEKEELQEYSNAYQNTPTTFIVNTQKEHSITGARQTILQHARVRGLFWYWQLDDTIRHIGRRKVPEAKTKWANPFECLLELQKMISLSPNIALVSPDLRHIAWTEQKDFTLDTRCMIITGTRTDTGLNYNLNLEMKEDLDFCLRTLHNGWSTVLCHLLIIEDVSMGYNKTGGMTERYKNRAFHQKAVDIMCASWPRYCRATVRRRRPEVSIEWKRFNQKSSLQTEKSLPL